MKTEWIARMFDMVVSFDWFGGFERQRDTAKARGMVRTVSDRQASSLPEKGFLLGGVRTKQARSSALWCRWVKEICRSRQEKYRQESAQPIDQKQ